MRFIRSTLVLALASVACVNGAFAQQGKYVSIYAKQDSSIKFDRFADSAVNIEFNYPHSLAKTPDADKDSVVKLTGVVDEKHLEVKLSKLQGGPDIKLAEQLIAAEFRKNLPASALVSRRDIRFGKGFTFNGSEQVYDFHVGDQVYTMRVVLFSSGDQTFILSFSNAARGDLKSICEQMLASVQVRSASSAVSRSTNSESFAFEQFTDPSRQITFDYPQGWKLERDPGKEFELKFRGSNKAGLGAELVVNRLERSPFHTIDQFYEMYEQTYLKPLKNYQKLSTTRTSFGVTRQEGSLTSSTFTAEGHQFRHLTAFFAEGKYYYAVALTGGVWTEREMRNVFDRILASFKITE